MGCSVDDLLVIAVYQRKDSAYPKNSFALPSSIIWRSLSICEHFLYCHYVAGLGILHDWCVIFHNIVHLERELPSKGNSLCPHFQSMICDLQPGWSLQPKFKTPFRLRCLPNCSICLNWALNWTWRYPCGSCILFVILAIYFTGPRGWVRRSDGFLNGHHNLCRLKYACS